MEETKKKFDMSYVHAIIGFAICAIFWLLPEDALAPMTGMGLKCIGVLLAMVYLWSTIGTLWPSIWGLFMLGISGYAGDGSTGFNTVWLNAVGNNTVLLVMLGMILFGALDTTGGTKIVARWLLTRKFYAGKPITFMAVFYFTCALISAFVSPIVGLIMLWPIATSIVDVLGVKREDKVWKWFFVGMFLCMTLAQPLVPFKGAPLIPISAFTKMSGMEIPYAQYMLVDVVMTVLSMGIFFLLMKLLRVDVSKFKAMSPEYVEQQMEYVKPNAQQIYFLVLIPVFVCLVLIPSFMSSGVNPVIDLFKTISTLGVATLLIIVSLILKFNGKPMLDFQYVAYKNMNWGIFFMIAAAVYAAGTLSSDSTGVTTWLVQVLNPILGGQSEMGFVAIMFLVALVITNFANNAAMAVVLLPVAITFSNQLGISPIPVVTGIVLMVFVAMLTPSASPHAGMMWGRRDLYSPKDILSIGLPMCLIVWALYVCIGYPLIKVLMGV